MSKNPDGSAFINELKLKEVYGWRDISAALKGLKLEKNRHLKKDYQEFAKTICKGLAFITFDYGVDGVSIEISKYARCLQTLLAEAGTTPSLHFIGGDFYSGADSVLPDGWNRYRLEGSNGWSKWDNGKWFDKLFYKKWHNDEESNLLAREIWRQALSLTERLADYVIDNEIKLLIPVNVCSNPGNIATCIAVILVSELIDLYVMNSNHDYYWEGGKPEVDYKNKEARGVRDHFFTNCEHIDFFKLFKSIYPWDGGRWMQLNINRLQSDKLLKEMKFSENKVRVLTTAVSEKFFENYTTEDVRHVRERMAYILSGGSHWIRPLKLASHLKNLTKWMKNQQPVVCSFQGEEELDIASEEVIYLLQPTRVIERKRIERDIDLISALLDHPNFRNEFDCEPSMIIVLHITGPTPIEHQHDLEVILNSFLYLLESNPASISNRLFIAFSVGHEFHFSFEPHRFKKLDIEDIYRLATAVLFPSETEGRGLPIIESGASGIPIVCSRYVPEEVFADVIGESLTEAEQISYMQFPEHDFSHEFLEDLTQVLIEPGKNTRFTSQNREVVHKRYSFNTLIDSFRMILDEMRKF